MENLKKHLAKIYEEVEAITKKYNCKLKTIVNDRGVKVTDCYGRPLTNAQKQQYRSDHNNTCCHCCGYLTSEGCTTRNLACKIWYCMPMLKKIQKKNFEDYKRLTTLKMVYDKGQFYNEELYAHFVAQAGPIQGGTRLQQYETFTPSSTLEKEMQLAGIMELKKYVQATYNARMGVDDKEFLATADRLFKEQVELNKELIELQESGKLDIFN